MADSNRDPGCKADTGAKQPSGRRMRILGVLCLLGVFAGLFWQGRRAALGPYVKTGRTRLACELRARDILRAFQVYTMEHGRLPPAYIADKQGRPMHSWRVLIWPYLEKNKAYRQYRWDQPWNSESNLKLVDQMPRALRCPRDAESGPEETSFLLLTGPGTWFDKGSSPRPEQLPNPQRTILLIEAAGQKVHWMEPRDLDVSRLPVGELIRSFHNTGKTCGLADGSVEVLKDDVTVGDILPFVRKSEWPYRQSGSLPVASP